jgi:hypothetical protein
MRVRAKVTHTEPGTQRYRTENEEFEHTGKLYKHVEPVKGSAEESGKEDK